MWLTRRSMIAWLPLVSALSKTCAASALPSSNDASVERLSYSMRVAGVQIARIHLVLEPEGDRLSLRLSMRNKGVAVWLAGETITEMQARVLDDGTAPARPLGFTARYEKPDRTREIELRYDPAGDLESVEILNRGRPRESRVPAELQHGTVDPLTALVRLRAWLRSAPAAGDELALPVFEGRKRLDLNARYSGLFTDHILEVSLVGRSGFDAGDQLVTLPGEPRRWLHVRVSSTASVVPISVSTGDASIQTVIELEP